MDGTNWPTLALVTILVLQHVKKSKGGFTVARILTRIPSRDGFERLARNLRSKLAGSGEGAPPPRSTMAAWKGAMLDFG